MTGTGGIVDHAELTDLQRCADSAALRTNQTTDVFRTERNCAATAFVHAAALVIRHVTEYVALREDGTHRIEEVLDDDFWRL